MVARERARRGISAGPPWRGGPKLAFCDRFADCSVLKLCGARGAGTLEPVPDPAGCGLSLRKKGIRRCRQPSGRWDYACNRTLRPLISSGAGTYPAKRAALGQRAALLTITRYHAIPGWPGGWVCKGLSGLRRNREMLVNEFREGGHSGFETRGPGNSPEHTGRIDNTVPPHSGQRCGPTGGADPTRR